MSSVRSRRGFLKVLATGTASVALARRLEAAETVLRGDLVANSAWRGDIQGLRERYLLDPDITYLNHASIGTVPRAVHRARVAYTELCETNPWLYMWGGAWEEAREITRGRAADLLGCHHDEIAITHNTTEGFNILAQGLSLGPGDEVLFSSLNHPGASICWQHQGGVAGFGVRSFDFPVADAASLTPSDVIQLHLDQLRDETRVLVIPHIDNMIGVRHSIRELTAAARRRGVEWVLVDGAQSIGMIPLDLERSGVDAYAGSPHKWVQSPKGLGLLYVRRTLQERLRPMWVTWGQGRWAGSARIFEDYGTRNLAEALSLGNALDFQASLGQDEKVSRYRALRAFMRDRVADSERLRWLSPEPWELGGALVAVGFGDRPAPELSQQLYLDHGVVLRPFHEQGLDWFRLSPNVANSEDELARFFELLGRALS